MLNGPEDEEFSHLTPTKEIEDKKEFFYFITSDSKRPFYIDAMRTLFRQYDNCEISPSKLTEELNFTAFKWEKEKNAGNERDNN